MPSDQQSWFSSLYSWNEVEGIQISPMVIYQGKVVSRWGAYTHPYYTWWWFDSGEVKLETPGETFHVRAGEWVFIPSNIRRVQTFAADSRIISMNFFAHWPNGLPLLFLPYPIMGDEDTCPPLRRLASRVCTALKKNKDGEYHLSRMNLTLPEVLAVKSRLNEFVNVLFEYAASNEGTMTMTTHEDPRLAQVLNWIQENPGIGPLPFDKWREQIGLGRSQLENLARKYLKMSLVMYRNRLLAAEACRRLGVHAALVKQVASDLGFVDSSHFCRWLQQQTGRNPGDFRNHHV